MVLLCLGDLVFYTREDMVLLYLGDMVLLHDMDSALVLEDSYT